MPIVDVARRLAGTEVRRVAEEKESLFQVEPDNVYTEELVHVQHALFSIKSIVDGIAAHEHPASDSVLVQLQGLATTCIDSLAPELTAGSQPNFLCVYRNIVGLSAAYRALQALGRTDLVKDDRQLADVIANLDQFASKPGQHPLLQHESVALFTALTSSHEDSDLQAFVKEYALLAALTMSNATAGSLHAVDVPPAASEDALLQPSLVLGLPVMTADSPFGDAFTGLFAAADVQDVEAAFDSAEYDG